MDAMTPAPAPCPGYAEMEGRCNNPALPEVGLCTRCAQLEIAHTPQGEVRGCVEVRWGYDDMGTMQ